MVDQQSNWQRHHNGNNISKQKCGNQDGKEGEPVSPTEAEEPKTLTNIYYDCLERIFDFLDLVSILNVARTCKRLQIAAAPKFSDDYSKKRIILHQFSIERKRGAAGIFMNSVNLIRVTLINTVLAP